MIAHGVERLYPKIGRLTFEHIEAETMKISLTTGLVI